MKNPMINGYDYGVYEGRTDDVMKLLMIGFEGLFRICNPPNRNGMARHWRTELVSVSDFTDEYPDQTGAAISLVLIS